MVEPRQFAAWSLVSLAARPCLQAWVWVLITTLALASCHGFQSLEPAEVLTPTQNAQDPDFQSGDIDDLVWDLKDDRLACVNPRTGHLLVAEGSNNRRLRDDVFSDCQMVWLDKQEAGLVFFKGSPAVLSVRRVTIPRLGNLSWAPGGAITTYFPAPVPPAQEETNRGAPGQDTRFLEARLGEKHKILVLIQSNGRAGLMVYPRFPLGPTNGQWVSFPLSIQSPVQSFRFQKFLLGAREEMAYALHTSSSRRGIERTMITRFSTADGKVLSRVSYRTHPQHLFAIFDDAEILFSRFDEADGQWVFEHRHVDADRVRTERTLALKKGSPIRIQAFGHSYAGILRENGRYSFCLFR